MAAATGGYDVYSTSFFAYLKSEPRGVEVIRLQRRSFHHYAVGTTERDQAQAAGWNVEQTQFRAELP